MIPKEKLYIHLPFFKLIENLEEFCQLGANCEIYMSAEALNSLNAKTKDMINVAFDKYNLSKSIHAPFIDLNPGSMDKDIRMISLGRFKQCIDACVKFKTDRMIIHTHFNHIFYKSHKQEWLDNSVEILQSLFAYAREKKVTIAIENSTDPSPWAVLELLKKISPLKACFDIAHYNVFSQAGWEEELMKYPLESIIEVHLSDNDGTADEHLPLGEGSIDFKKFFKILDDKKISPFVVLEPHDKQGLYKNLEYIRKLKI